LLTALFRPVDGVANDHRLKNRAMFRAKPVTKHLSGQTSTGQNWSNVIAGIT
jgi:hypothetical protein